MAKKMMKKAEGTKLLSIIGDEVELVF